MSISYFYGLAGWDVKRLLSTGNMMHGAVLVSSSETALVDEVCSFLRSCYAAIK